MKVQSVLATALVVFAGLTAQAQVDEAQGYIVKLRGEPTESAVRVMATSTQVERLSEDSPVYYVQDAKSVMALAPEVEYIERNQAVHILGQPSAWTTRQAANPKEYANDWGHKAIKADRTKAAGFTGRGIVVAVIDTGVDARHPELAGKVLTSEGYNFATNTVDATDDHGHGTHCAGIIASGVFGTAPDVKIVPIKFLTASGGGTTANAIKAVEHARKKKVNVISNSWGGPIISAALAEQFRLAIDEGIIVLAAAGNDGANNDNGSSFPANYPNVVSVAAMDDNGTLASFSNFGQKVLIGAPGVKIYSSSIDGAYEKWDGTSMAAPFVSGVAALYQGKAKRTPANFRDCLKRTADVPAVPLRIETRGMVNALRVVNECT